MSENDDTVFPFAGLTVHDQDVQLPEDAVDHGSSMTWWATESQFGGSTPDDDTEEIHLPDEGLNTLIDQLPRASTTEVAWRHPISGEWIRTEKHNAVIDPEAAEKVSSPYPTAEAAKEDNVMMEMLGDDDGRVWGDSALYSVPTDDYTIINPAQFLRPFAEVLSEEDLADKCFGEVRLYRAGGKASMDVYFDGMHVQAPEMDDDRKPIVVGLQFDWDHFGGTSLRIQGVGMDWECVNSIRSITDAEVIKHSGDVDSRIEWRSIYHNLLEQLDLKIDQLSQLIAEASEQHLDMSEFPDDFTGDYDSILEAFYAYSGLPEYLSEVAARNCRAEAEDPFNPTMWDLHRGATYAISHHARGDVSAGGAIDQYNRIANDFLTNPAAAAERVEEDYAATHGEEDLAEQSEGTGHAQVLAATETIRERKQEYEERQETIQRLTAGAE